VYITRVRVRTREPTPERVCELDVHPIRVRRSPPRTEDVLYGVECGMRPLTSESHRRSTDTKKLMSFMLVNFFVSVIL
jgi:hypothetical protein